MDSHPAEADGMYRTCCGMLGKRIFRRYSLVPKDDIHRQYYRSFVHTDMLDTDDDKTRSGRRRHMWFYSSHTGMTLWNNRNLSSIFRDKDDLGAGRRCDSQEISFDSRGTCGE